MVPWRNQKKLLLSQKLMVCCQFAYALFVSFVHLNVIVGILTDLEVHCLFVIGRLFCTVGVHPTRCKVGYVSLKFCCSFYYYIDVF